MSQERNSPLTARSVLASALLGASPPVLPVAHLIHLAGLFGINENRARVALSRMTSSGEVTKEGSGRYRLAGHLLERQSRQQASRVGLTKEWDGSWTMAVITALGSAPDARSLRRKNLSFARMAELRDGIWLRPDNLEVRLAPETALEVVLFQGRPMSDPVGLAARLWDLEGWGRRATVLLEQIGDYLPREPTDLAPGFELSAAVLRHLQADPLLPDALLPGTWPGTELRTAYDRWDAAYRRVLAEWGRTA